MGPLAAHMTSTKSRAVLIAGNWKMNHGARETADFFSKLSELRTTLTEAEAIELSGPNIKVGLFPPAISMAQAVDLAALNSFPISVGSQNTHWEKKGAFTGEVSSGMLSEIGVQASLVGHSERRQLFGETDETVRKRGEHLLEQGFQVILCIGETKSERERGETNTVLFRQLEGAIPAAQKGMANFLDGRLVLAYEPVWAIGTGANATPQQAEETHQFIRKSLWDRFGMEAASRTQILYGGSVTPENIDSILKCTNVDGALVGGASLKPDAFLALIQAGIRAVKSVAKS
jgi:triosephosphate isomerase